MEIWKAFFVLCIAWHATTVTEGELEVISGVRGGQEIRVWWKG